MFALVWSGEVLCTRGITWVEARMNQEYGDRDSTPLQVRFELPKNASKTHPIKVRIKHIVFFFVNNVFHCIPSIAYSKVSVSIFTRRYLSPVMRDGSNCTLLNSSPAGNVVQHAVYFRGIQSNPCETARQTACPIVFTEKSLSLSPLYPAVKATKHTVESW